MPLIKTILFPTDFSETSSSAFKYACSLAQENRAKLVALHVMEPVTPAMVEGIIMPTDVEGVRVAVQQQLWNLSPTVSGLNFERIFREGPAAPTIAKTADEIGADLIVMGTHGRTGIVRLLLGSVAEHVLRNAHCPVLFVKQARISEQLAGSQSKPMAVGAGI